MFGEGSALDEATKNQAHYVAKLAKGIEASVMFDRKALIEIMNEKYSFPDENRTIMWRYILCLPMNEEQYLTLHAQPIHPSIRRLPSILPIKYSNVSNRMMRILSCLVYWHPPLAECDWLPGLIYPFLCIFGRDKITTVEVIMTVILNWCTEWLHFIPNPPITSLSRIDRIAHDMGGEAPLSVAWPALRSLFGEVATNEAALLLLDNIISSKPPFLEYLVAAYATLPNHSVINGNNVKRLINHARAFYNKDWQNNPNQSVFKPLPSGYYPILPIVVKSEMWREKELQRIRSEAEATKQQMELAADIETEKLKIARKKKSWLAQRTALREIEQEQMEEFRRREKEMLMRENIKEEESQRMRKENMKKRQIEEEDAIQEWQSDTSRIQNELERVAKMRQETWTKWLQLKEDSARLSKEEVDMELQLLEKSDAAQAEQLSKHNEAMESTAKAEQDIVSEATRRSQELEDEKGKMLEALERARRKQTQGFKLKPRN